jgi:hypothetical protein
LYFDEKLSFFFFCNNISSSAILPELISLACKFSGIKGAEKEEILETSAIFSGN